VKKIKERGEKAREGGRKYKKNSKKPVGWWVAKGGGLNKSGFCSKPTGKKKKKKRGRKGSDLERESRKGHAESFD